MRILGSNGNPIYTNGKLIVPPDDSSDLNGILSRTIPGEYTNDSVTAIGNYAFYICKQLTGVTLQTATSIGAYAFSGCSRLEHFYAPIVTLIGTYVFSSCGNLSSVNIPSATSIGIRAFNACSNLTYIDLPSVNSIETYAFYNCRKLVTVVLRGEEVPTLKNVTAFNQTPIGSGTGYVYVPSALVESYKTSAGWVNIKNQIRAIEDYPDITGS